MKKLFSLFVAILFVGSMWAASVAPQGTTLFSENFGGYSADAVPSGSVTTATNYRVVYGNASVTYTCTNGTKSSGSTNGGTTKVMNSQQGAEGTLPELMVGKKGVEQKQLVVLFLLQAFHLARQRSSQFHISRTPIIYRLH